ncbi:conjugative transposon protein TraJ [Sphingobacterium cellulitidis]|uniref:conjugative transposon protein TraJ n=1 Tax=Sphingobacterium cellulitidis TaxID=1768011 RepID=UPI000B944FAE|nr:conjugative transposon protein TraJ [Sphingobacterium cellulitidis]OYD46514.1 conjugative transposon protein TraJ [Sphingobacterium cellulitidis]
MKTIIKYGLALLSLIGPIRASAQDLSENFSNFQLVLEQLYDEMMPLCSNLMGVGQGLAGFAALWFISSRVWKHIAAAEPIDIFPLLRPFAIGFCISIFPSVMGLVNGVLSPTVRATSAMVGDSNQAISELLMQKRKALEGTELFQMYVGLNGQGDRDRWYRYTNQGEDPQSEGFWEGLGNDYKFAMAKAAYNFRNSIKEWMSEVLSLLFQAAALCIDCLRTFQLVVLSVLGPIVFGLSVFDGFQHSLAIWLARYINIYLWLPVANIFGSLIGKIQQNMLRLDISQIEESGYTMFSPSDGAYLIFLIIGIVGYFAVPTIANYIVNASESGAFVRNVTNIFLGTTTSLPTRMMQNVSMSGDAMGDSAARNSSNMVQRSQSEPYFKDSAPNDNYMQEKLKGNP